VIEGHLACVGVEVPAGDVAELEELGVELGVIGSDGGRGGEQEGE
jgi:hypothetical protein